MISHKHKFIFVHIPKNAGSSINHELKNMCEIGDKMIKDITESNNWFRPDDIYPRDIPKAYGKHANDNDMRILLKDEYADYYKFCVVRNPWDRLVSIYWYELGTKIPTNWSFSKFIRNIDKLLRADVKGQITEYRRAVSWDYKNIIPKINRPWHKPGGWKDLHRLPAYQNIERQDIVHEGALTNTVKSQCKWIGGYNDYIYGKKEQNYVIVRFEYLEEDILNVYGDIGYEPTGKLAHKNRRNYEFFMNGSNKNYYNNKRNDSNDRVDSHYRDMYSEEEVEIVRVLYKDDIDRFGYKF